MKKIPTLLRRDPDDMSRVLDEVHPDCQWVLDGEGWATRKFDGTCVMYDADANWWARREVKPDRQPPPGFVEIEHDETTGKRVGWEPAEQSGFAKYLREAESHTFLTASTSERTFELVGPKINKNPERTTRHTLIEHGTVPAWPETGPRTVERIKQAVYDLGERGIEGVVYHHPDGRRAKLKARDLR